MTLAPMHLQPNITVIQEFFEGLYGQAEDGKLILSSPSTTRLRPDGTPGLDSNWIDVSQASWSAIARAASRRAYFGVVLQQPTAVQVGHARGRIITAYLAPGLWMDIDLAAGAHKQTGPLPLHIDEVLAFLATLPRYPSLIVNTGGGCHAHWLFREPFLMHSDGDRAEFAHLARRFTATLGDRAKSEYGWQLDRLGDLARVLRAPGTITTKYQCQVALWHSSDMRYNPVQDFDDWLDVLPIPQRAMPMGVTLGAHLDIQVVANHYNTRLTKKSATELAGPHPVHGSSTGSNFNVCPSKNLWHCWRCGSGGDALSLMAVCEGLLPCDQARSGALRGSLFRRVAHLVKDVFGVPLPRHKPPTPPWTDAKEVPPCPIPWRGESVVAATQPIAWHNTPQRDSPWH